MQRLGVVPFKASEFLRDDEDVRLYLEAAVEDDRKGTEAFAALTPEQKTEWARAMWQATRDMSFIKRLAEPTKTDAA